ncbi:PepSY domain-containing protein [uncultured Psychrobacter sp.]|uniref:PepSY domain-containing protein n=1 Tax=uncultured Psychrobacter sp. TaxID=259303 RepID=UPI00345A824F
MSNIFKRFQLTTLAGCLGLALTVGAVSTAATADTADEIRAAQAAKISLTQAVDIASKQVSGTLMNAEFDDDDDDAQGNGGVYELEFSDGSTEYEVKVDAVTGDIVELDTDSLDSGDKDDYDVQRRAKISAMGIINSVDSKDGNRILEIEFDDDGDSSHPTYYEVDMLSDNQVIEVKIDAETGREFERRNKD